MNVQCFILLEIVVRLHYVVSYTVVLKQVKSLYPPVKVYRYDLRQPKLLDMNLLYSYKPILSQKIYPIRPRGVKKKEAKYVKSLSTDKPVQKDDRLYGISQQLVPPLSNQTEKFSDGKEAVGGEALKEDIDARPLSVLPPQDKSFPSFGQEKGKIYKSAGEWAVPVPKEDSENTTESAFTPSQLYLQIRHKNTVIHVPQSEALKDSETLEELINAPRLKELARTTHVQETYSEEGYEDAAYDHAGQIRQAQHGEIYDAKDEGKFKIKEAPVILNYDSDLEESKTAPLNNLKGTDTTNANPQQDTIIKREPRITQLRTEMRKTGVDDNKEPPANYKGEHIFSSRVKLKMPMLSNGSETIRTMGPVTFPSFFDEMSLPPDKIFTHDSVLTSMKLPMKKSSKYRKEDLNSTKIYPVRFPTNKPDDQFTGFKPFIAAADSQPSPSSKSLKYNRIYSKKTKQLRLEPYKIGNVYTPSPPSDHLQPPVEKPEEHINQRIVLPTIGYINSLTTAHFGKNVSANVRKEPKVELTSALNLTQALNYLRSNNNQKILEEPMFFNETDLKTFEPMRLKKQRLHYRDFASKTKRDVYLMKEQDSVNKQSEYKGNDEKDLPYNEKNSEILEDEAKRIEEENREKEIFEAELKEEIMAKEKEIIKEALKDTETDSPESFQENFFPESHFHLVKPTAPSSVDFKKYPFYRSKTLPENSPLRYASDPMTFPRKSGYGMEFYESRERVIQCPDFHPDFDDSPNSNSSKYSDNKLGNNQRLTSLGDKISCLRSKYFDPEPFDNPIFKEKEIDYVGKSKKKLKKVSGPQSKIAKKHREMFKKFTTSAPNTKKEFETLIITERPFRTQQVSESVMLLNKGDQHILPTKILPFFSIPKTSSLFVKPETDIPKWFSSLATESKAKVKPPTRWKAILHPQSTFLEPTKIVLRKNCMHVITKLAVLNGANDLTIECNDAIFIQEILNGVAHIRIIPKERWSAKISSEQPLKASDWVPIIGYAVSNFTSKTENRKTDEITIPKKEKTTEKPNSDQYVIDELKEDKNVRQGEVVEDIDHYLKITESVKMTSEGIKKNEKRKREAIDLKFKKGNHGVQRPTGAVVFDAIEKLTQDQVAVTKKKNETAKTTFSKLFETKRTLGRLSGRDFLTRYHKNKSKPKVADFWKIVSMNKNLQNPEKTTPASSLGNIFQERSASNVLLVTNATDEKPMSLEERKTKFGGSNFKTVTPITLIIKKPQNKVSKNASQMSRSPENSAKNITEMNKELSESSKKVIIVDKKSESTTIKENLNKTSKKPEVQYKTINRNKNYPKKAEKENSSSESPTLYYIIDVRTGRGEWITNYEEQRLSGKFREKEKLKGNIERRKYKKQKKTKY